MTTAMTTQPSTRSGASSLGVRVMPRADALPEHQRYRDEGCDLFPSCLACPLARCRYDEPGGVRALLNRERDRQIRALREREGLRAEEIAARLSVSRRTVFRVLQQPGFDGRIEARMEGRMEAHVGARAKAARQ